MGFAEKYFNRPGPGIDRNAPKKKGMALFFEIFWREFWALLKLNMLFLLFCLPVVTIPAAITAMNGITLAMVRDENHFLFADFFRVFKREFGRSLAAGWICLLGMAATGFGVYFYSAMQDMGWFRLIPAALGAVGFLLLYIMTFYVFPQLAVLDISVKNVLKNAFYLAFVCIRHSIVVFLATGLLLLLGFGLLPYSIPTVAMLIFAFNSLIVCFHAHPAMERYLILRPACPESADGPNAETEQGDWRDEREALGKDGPA